MLMIFVSFLLKMSCGDGFSVAEANNRIDCLIFFIVMIFRTLD